ncbi:MAG: hypothetical protein C5B43_01630 [Verrucomicrobia bacterium]|nr:MAG: hypothetical protein C5B43_01630 [Verrucomicrobiota bacterium]
MKKLKFICFLFIIILFLCIQYDNQWHYSGNLRIPISLDLKREEAIDEASFAADLQDHLLESEERYRLLPDSLNGKIISTDLACHLYKPFAALSNAKDRLKYFFSTRIPASWFMNYVYYKKLVEIKDLKEQEGQEKMNVVFLAGGDGSGKTSAVRYLGLPIIENADVIRDATMSSSFEYHKKVIEKTLELGFEVTIIYVFRPIELALEANISRAEEEGRIRPIGEIVDAHYRAQQNVVKLIEFFGDKIEFLVIDNRRSFQDIHVVDNPVEFLTSTEVYYMSREIVMNRALLTYAKQNKEEISEPIIEVLEHKLNLSSTNIQANDLNQEGAHWFKHIRKLIDTLAMKFKAKGHA